MKVIKPRLISHQDITSSTIQVDPIPEWSSGANYEIAGTFTSIPAEYRNLVKKSTFQDGNSGGWVGSDTFTCAAKAIKELRLSKTFLKFSQTIPVSGSETLYIAFTVNSEFSEIPGKFGVRAVGSNLESDTVGVSFTAGKIPAAGYFTGSITVPSGVTSVNPVIYIPNVSGKPRPRYVAFLDLCISRNSDLSSNLLTKQNFNDGTGVGIEPGYDFYISDSTSYKASETSGCLATGVTNAFREEGNTFRVYGGETIYLSFDVKASAGSAVNVGFTFLSKAGASLGTQVAPFSGSLSLSSWARSSYAFSVPENAYFAIPSFVLSPSSGTAYINNLYAGRKTREANGPLVKRGSLATIYQCVTAGVSTVAPELDPNNWVPVMATNEWAAFDREPETASTAFGSLSVTVKLNGANSLALFGVKCDSLTVAVPGIYGPKTFGSNPVVLTDLPSMVNFLEAVITLTGTGQVSLGLVDIGTAVDLGGTDYGATFTIVDYSRREVDEFGTASFVKRGFAKKISAKSMFANTDLNKITSTLSELRATPCSWSITDEVGLETMNIFGWYEDLDINIPYPKHSYCSVNIQGLIE